MIFLVAEDPMDGLEEMARGCFGYGRWDAPYWLIGLEEGMSGTLDNRIRAFQKLDKDGLCDSRKFHHEIGVHHHHQDSPPLATTWRVLILILLTYLGRPCGRSLAEKIHVVPHVSRYEHLTPRLPVRRH
jgi:hypothetical protein